MQSALLCDAVGRSPRPRAATDDHQKTGPLATSLPPSAGLPQVRL